MWFHVSTSQATTIFGLTFMLLGLAAMVATSARTGMVAYSLRSALRTTDSKPQWAVDKSKLPQYLQIVILAPFVSGFFVATFDMNLEDIAIGAFMYTAVVAWGCYYWVLCKNKPEADSK